TMSHLKPRPAPQDAAPDMKAEFEHMRQRLRAAHAAGRGVHLTAREVQLLGVSVLAEWWSADNLDQPVRFD
ncbi:hypothetical protein ACRCPG_25095, partial [Pseudomonas aeruginosa]